MIDLRPIVSITSEKSQYPIYASKIKEERKAVLTKENRVMEIVTADRDFYRFKEFKIINPFMV